MSTSRSLIQFDNTKDLASWYDQKYTEMGGGWSMMPETANEILEFIGITLPQPTKTLLDVGCGEGYFVQHVSSNFFKCVGIDISEVIVKKAQDRSPNDLFLAQDIETMSAIIKFDYITSVGSIEHCIDVNKALKKVKALLNEGGLFYALVPNEEWLHMDQPQEQTHADEEWTEMFTQAGFSIVKQRRNRDLSEFLLQ